MNVHWRTPSLMATMSLMDDKLKSVARLFAAFAICATLTAAAARIEGTDGSESIAGTAGDDVILGKGGNDTILAGDGNDTLIGGPGSDMLDPGRGNDSILLGPGSGRDQLTAGDDSRGKYDVIRFDKVIKPEMVTLTRRAPNALVVSYGRGDEFMSKRHFEIEGYGSYRLDAIEFASGGKWDADKIRKMVLAPSTKADFIVGYTASEKLTGWEGNDRIFGGPGNDEIKGGPGNDQLTGDEGNDTLIGGAGDDRLRGELGSDTYIYRPGDGMDTIQNYSRAWDVDVIRFPNFLRGSVDISTRGNDLLLIVGKDRNKTYGLRVLGFNSSNSHPITRIEFKEGKPIDVRELIALFPASTKSSRSVAGNSRNQAGQSRLVRPPPRAASPKGQPSTIKVRSPFEQMIQQETTQNGSTNQQPIKATPTKKPS